MRCDDARVRQKNITTPYPHLIPNANVYNLNSHRLRRTYVRTIFDIYTRSLGLIIPSRLNSGLTIITFYNTLKARYDLLYHGLWVTTYIPIIWLKYDIILSRGIIHVLQTVQTHWYNRNNNKKKIVKKEISFLCVTRV